MDPEEKISEALNGIIEPGTSWIVRGISNDVLVEPFDVVGDRKKAVSPALQLKLDTLNEQLSSAGGGLMLFSMLAVVIGCIGIHLGWFDVWLGDKDVYVKSIWLYLAVFVATFFLLGHIGQRRESAIYRRYREELEREMKQDGLDMSELYVRIKDDEELSNVVECIKDDIRNLAGEMSLY